jgi:hypothetical protein
MRLSYSVFWQMDINYSPSLQHKLPDQAVRNSFIYVANIDSSLFVLLPVER